MIMKKKIIAIFLALTVVFCLSACQSSDGGDTLSGTWKGPTSDGITFTWNFDGKGACSIKNEYGMSGSGTYTLNGDKVTIKIDLWKKEKVYKYDVSGSTLKLTNTDKISPDYSLEKQP